jgi:CTP:molybdopterin cytidylyltransferase MocA
MISAAVLCPHPPLLLRELGGAQDPVGALRAAAVAAVRAATARAERVVVVGGHDEAGAWEPETPVDVRRFGTTGGRPPRPGLPVSLGVGSRLLTDAGWTGPVELLATTWHADAETVDRLADDLAERPRGTVALLLGDGSTRRGHRAPGYLDDRAFGFDDAVAKALATGDADALRDLDTALAEELMVLGSASLRVLGALAVRHGGPSNAGLDYRDDPFGVSYFVATWTF